MLPVVVGQLHGATVEVIEAVRVEVEVNVSRRGFAGPTIGGGMELPKLPPGPAIAVGLSLWAGPARMDIYLPFEAIKRVMTALEHDSPM